MRPVSLMAEHCALGLLGKWEEAYMPTHTSLAQAQTQSLEFATFCAPQYFDIYFPASPSAIHNFTADGPLMKSLTHHKLF